MLKKLKLAIQAAEAAEAARAAADIAYAQAADSSAAANPYDTEAVRGTYSVLAQARVDSCSALVDNAAARKKVCKILQKMLAQYS